MTDKETNKMDLYQDQFNNPLNDQCINMEDTDESKNSPLSMHDDEEPPALRSMRVQSPVVVLSHENLATHEANEKLNLQQRRRTRYPTGWAPSDQLRRLGYDHLLEPTHVVTARNDLVSVLDRLLQAFYCLSLQVDYETDNLSAHCLSMEQVEFQISLYLHRHDTTQIYIEIQRLAGDAYMFHCRYAQTLLAAVLVGRHEPLVHLPGVAPQPQPQTQTYLFSFATNCDKGHAMDRLTENDNEGDKNIIEKNQSTNINSCTALSLTSRMVESSLACTVHLLNSPCLDARQLGLESLLALTDPAKTGWQTALAVARVLGTTTTATTGTATATATVITASPSSTMNTVEMMRSILRRLLWQTVSVQQQANHHHDHDVYHSSTSSTSSCTSLGSNSSIDSPCKSTSTSRYSQSRSSSSSSDDSNDYTRDTTQTHWTVLQIWTHIWQILAKDCADNGSTIRCIDEGDNDDDTAATVPLNLSRHELERLASHLMQRVEYSVQAGKPPCPHRATMALQGLQALIQLVPSLRGSIAWPVVETAHAVGQSQHAALQQASQQLLLAS